MKYGMAILMKVASSTRRKMLLYTVKSVVSSEVILVVKEE